LPTLSCIPGTPKRFLVSYCDNVGRRTLCAIAKQWMAGLAHGALPVAIIVMCKYVQICALAYLWSLVHVLACAIRFRFSRPTAALLPERIRRVLHRFYPNNTQFGESLIGLRFPHLCASTWDASLGPWRVRYKPCAAMC
jgi:hypothetical protein